MFARLKLSAISGLKLHTAYDMYYQIKQVKILLKRGHTKMLIFDISGSWALYYTYVLQKTLHWRRNDAMYIFWI